MRQINPQNIRDCTSNSDKLSSAFRFAGTNGKKFLHHLIYEIDVIAQADGTISAGDKTKSTDYLALIADDTFFDKIVKKI